MEEKNINEIMDKVDDVMLPGFRFHPTDEELVGFYLKKKLEQQSLPIELIKQVDIYKYDPWDLPKLASTGEKEWYFYCPRDRKYRNSARPNRVTGAGFWKATGTDRPIYSSDGTTKCIGLKKSLVFYRGRAAKGFKTDWMMHEFRLPSLSTSSFPKKPLDKSFSAHDSWAICRIFKKTNSVAMAQRALSHSWASSLTDIAAAEMFSHAAPCGTHFSPENISCTNETQILSNLSFAKPSIFPFSNEAIHGGFMSCPLEVCGATKPSGGVDEGSMILRPDMTANLSSTNNLNDVNVCENAVEFDIGFSTSLLHNRSLGFPFNLPANDNAWKPNLIWDSLPSPSEMPTNKCYHN